MTPDPDESRIREKAYKLWVADGRPHGRDREHWELARELVAIEDSQRSTLKPVARESGEPVEPREAFERQADTAGLIDHGEAESGPTRQAGAGTASKRAATPPGRRVTRSKERGGKARGKQPPGARPGK
ncbi:Protein of unknown function [Rhizobiales bacterium GAS191]|nr:Protein of unknown function [Rhizobiales bacterium GAS188]SEF14805.1 Protein of unknown function [Rhizobiales bacterium GAS191]